MFILSQKGELINVSKAMRISPYRVAPPENPAIKYAGVDAYFYKDNFFLGYYNNMDEAEDEVSKICNALCSKQSVYKMTRRVQLEDGEEE